MYVQAKVVAYSVKSGLHTIYYVEGQGGGGPPLTPPQLKPRRLVSFIPYHQ